MQEGYTSMELLSHLDEGQMAKMNIKMAHQQLISKFISAQGV
jgi:hypothetical protein